MAEYYPHTTDDSTNELIFLKNQLRKKNRKLRPLVDWEVPDVPTRGTTFRQLRLLIGLREQQIMARRAGIILRATDCNHASVKARVREQYEELARRKGIVPGALVRKGYSESKDREYEVVRYNSDTITLRPVEGGRAHAYDALLILIFSETVRG